MMFAAAFRDRMADLMDAYSMGDIDRNTFLKRMQELNHDYYDAVTQANMIDEDRSNSHERR